MKRAFILSAAVAGLWLGLVSVSEAQVYVRAPFVRVGVGDGVAVRAPFVNLYVPGDGPVYYRPFGPRVIYVEQAPVVVQPMPPVQQQFPPPPKPISEVVPPPAQQQVQVPTLESFAKSFQPKAGAYEVAIVNPVTRQPTTVRFSLPEGTPRRVVTTRDSIEFIYSLRQWVRIEFDRDGVTVTSR
jgi:hypothetical protein